MARRVVATAVRLGDDADALGLDVERHDFAAELVAALLDGAAGRNLKYPWMLFRAPRQSRPPCCSRARRPSPPDPPGQESRGGCRWRDFPVPGGYTSGRAKQ